MWRLKVRILSTQLVYSCVTVLGLLDCLSMIRRLKGLLESPVIGLRHTMVVQMSFLRPFTMSIQTHQFTIAVMFERISLNDSLTAPYSKANDRI